MKLGTKNAILALITSFYNQLHLTHVLIAELVLISKILRHGNERNAIKLERLDLIAARIIV